MLTVNNVITEKDTIAIELKEKILNLKSKIGIIGLGYVGLPLAVEKCKAGFSVIGFDIDPFRVGMISDSNSYIGDVADEDLRNVVSKGQLTATTDFLRLSECDVVIICVPTPLTINRDPDISYIKAASEKIAENLRQGQLVTLESTTYPGTTEEVILPILTKTGLRIGLDFFLAYSPERVDPGNKQFTTQNTSKVVGGITPVCLELAYTLYQQTIINVVPVSSTAAAELTKIFENTYRAVNIALVNELMMLCERMGIDIWEIVEAAGTKPFGIQTFYPGPGVGGHCIPIDPFYLTWKAREYNFHTRFIELAGEINVEVSNYVVQKVVRVLNDNHKSVRDANVFVLGVAYKKDVNDLRESPALRVIELLRAQGADLSYHDPNIPVIEPQDGSTVFLTCQPLTDELLAQADCVLILTDHSNVDYNQVASSARLIVDTRNAMKNVISNRDKIIKI